MFKALQGGWKPPLHISEEEYKNVQNNKADYPDYYVGFIGFMGSYGSKYWGGYARAVKSDKITPRDMPNEAIRNLLKQMPNLKDVEFINTDYTNIEITKDCLIYCDPPYEGTTRYKTNTIDYSEYWNWVREISQENIVFVSEYNAPKDFKCIWSKNVTTQLKVIEHEPRIEKLFRYEAAA